MHQSKPRFASRWRLAIALAVVVAAAGTQAQQAPPLLVGTWHTDEGEVFRPNQTVPLKPGDFMRHSKGGPHYDGAPNEDTWVAISGYGPTKATVIDGGELFGRSK